MRQNHKILPEYYLSDENIHMSRALDALNQYSVYCIKKIPLPEVYNPQYNRLVNAIKNMPNILTCNKKQIVTSYPWLEPFITLLEHCLVYYPQVLSGKLNYMEVLFPNGNFELIEEVYKANPMSHYYSSIIGLAIKNFVQYYNYNKQKLQLKIMEIGAGTGTTTKTILQKLKASNIRYQYYYTDLSYAFLKKAQKEFILYPDIVYNIYNVEKEPERQMQRYFDIVVAAQVLHATSNIVNTLKNTHSLLKDNGILILDEGTIRQDYSTVVFGLATGWWLYSDHRIPDSPFISKDTWELLLARVGFNNVQSHGTYRNIMAGIKQPAI